MLIKKNNGDTFTGGGQMGLFWGQSSTSSDDAIQQAVSAAQQDLQGFTLEWLELAEVRGGFDSVTGVLQYQVAVRIGYRANG